MRTFTVTPSATEQRRYVPLPIAPQTTSPVPWLTSIHSTVSRGPYGDRRYRGNCDGYLIADLLHFFGSHRVFDPMTGSGTCADVCRELEIPCVSRDLNRGFNALNPLSYVGLGEFDFIWLHPPYWKMICYSDDPECMSNAPSLEHFTSMLRQLLQNCRSVLTPDGKIAVLMGGFSDRGRYMPLSYVTVHAALAEGLWPACTEIVRLQHGNTSSQRSYNRSFIPGLHDVCHVFEGNRAS